MENTSGTQSLRDTSAFMKKSKKFFKLLQKPNGEVFWKNELNKPLGENRIKLKEEEYDIKANIQACFNI